MHVEHKYFSFWSIQFFSKSRFDVVLTRQLFTDYRYYQAPFGRPMVKCSSHSQTKRSSQPSWNPTVSEYNHFNKRAEEENSTDAVKCFKKFEHTAVLDLADDHNSTIIVRIHPNLYKVESDA
ncbi:hypothetical protein RF11_10755 [Thelohanellus kitauei]|uniref:Uncharacterized protein n=1 Tax=Thelohanellus kitauei TaxID=669202 RepID=A0A0C2II61_THEKT|nr:hypothetical protein RF11_10755 [Thelohanellus kitauei]